MKGIFLMHVAMIVIVIAFVCNALARLDLTSMALGFIVPGLFISAHIAYGMKDSRRVRHRNRIYHHGPGTEIRVRYSRFVPMNYCVELFAGGCHVASLYRGNEDAVTIPPAAGKIEFMVEDTRIGEFDIVPDGDGCFYIFSENRIPLNLVPAVRQSGSFDGIDLVAEEESYNAVCRELVREGRFDLMFCWLELL